MCILFLYTDPSPPKGGYRLVVATNRDEYYSRPAEKLSHCSETNIIGGRDVEPGREGGMWLGVGLQPPLIKFGALVNITGEEKRPTNAGRGSLVSDYLKRGDSAVDYVKSVENNSYNAFNLIMLELASSECKVYHYSNCTKAIVEYPGKQILGFGNSTPDAPFTKVNYGKERFTKIVTESQDKNSLVENLIELLKCEDSHLPDPEILRRAPGALNFLSCIYIKIPEVGYGSRTHSVILVDDEWNVEFIEHTMKEPIDCYNPEWEFTTVKAHL